MRKVEVLGAKFGGPTYLRGCNTGAMFDTAKAAAKRLDEQDSSLNPRTDGIPNPARTIVEID
jgi:hypothetical protein